MYIIAHMYVRTYVHPHTEGPEPFTRCSRPLHTRVCMYVPGVLLFSWAKRVGSKVEVKVCGCIASEWRMVAKDMAACPCTSTGAVLTTVYK